ncbi:putative 30s ribosomal subunit s4 [Golovinomyces cichoracearum]|uniref:Putative 30s ribosomal subunit s4 n=1 Tax=Golovinomyces cichoracearum TaxID=62708 RepID=A0A420IGV8_9PEZI|nr:putative 30s ribosomal subunit s4 [Golovinomyces cichoracearum]
MARKPRFHGLKKPKIRSSWNKYNLYNLSRFKLPNSAYMTYFQQKWSAKSLTRAYHGDKIIREKQWQRMFSPNMNAVIPMDHKYLAEYDGSELAEGRGSGKDIDPSLQKGSVPVANKKIPYMNMTFAPLERRLDMAIFRSLFASSHKQARQMVVHGHVKVNGQKMAHPGYLLNPGDMFQVDPDVVQHATGDRLDKREKMLRKTYIRRAKITMSRKVKHLASYLKKDVLVAPKTGTYNDEPRKRLYWLKKYQNFWTYIKTTYHTYEPTRKIKYRNLMRSIEKLVANWYEMPWKKLDHSMQKVALEYRGARTHFPKETPERQEWLKRRLAIDRKRRADRYRRRHEKIALRPKESKEEKAKTSADSLPGTDQANTSTSLPPLTAKIPRIDPRLASRPGINIYMGQIEKLPIIKKPPYKEYEFKPNSKIRKRDRIAGIPPGGGSKTYPLPWRPKPFMAAFAFIPRYLEIRQNICAGVYLRHPVARPGLSEVPSPFPLETMQLAYNWYLRRR